jgi:hypothetical protein
MKVKRGRRDMYISNLMCKCMKSRIMRTHNTVQVRGNGTTPKRGKYL